MGTTLTGTTPANTYDSLIKVTDNGPIGATAKYLSDGLGNDSALALSTSSIGIATTSLPTSFALGSSTTGLSFTSASSSLNSGKIAVLKQVEIGSGNGDLTIETYAGGAGGGERMRITSTGNIGIGTSSPTDTVGYGRALDIQSATGAAVYLRDSDAPTTQYGFLAFDGQDNGLKLQNANSSGFLRFDTNATERMRITSTGNVGIGTSSPARKLEVMDSLRVTTAGVSRYFDVTEGTIKLYSSNAEPSIKFADYNTGLDRVATIGFEGNYFGRGAISFVVKEQASGTAAEAMRLTAAGVLDLAQGQIKFPATQVASADPNTLDDYEEGTWTPVYAGGITGATYLNTLGKYTKIGRVVHWSCRIQATAGTAAATALTIGGFPFTNSATVETAGSIGFFTVYTTDSVYMYNEPSTTSIAVFYNIDGTALAGTELTSVTGIIHCSGTYFV